MVSKYNSFDDDCKLIRGTPLSMHEADSLQQKVHRHRFCETRRKTKEIGNIVSTPFPVEREPFGKVQLRNVRRDNRGRLFRKFDGMRSLRERERHTIGTRRNLLSQPTKKGENPRVCINSLRVFPRKIV